MTEQFLTFGEAYALINEMKQVRSEYITEARKCNPNLHGMFQKGDEAITRIDSGMSGKWGGINYGDIIDLFFALQQESKTCFAKMKDTELLNSKKKIRDKIQAFGQPVGQYIELTDIVRGRGRVGEQFKKLGYNIIRVEKRVDFVDEDNKKHGDIDLYLETNEVCILIEIKLTLTKEHVRNYIEKLSKYRPSVNTQGKKMIGAVAGVRIEENVKKYAHNKKLYVLHYVRDQDHDVRHFSIAPTPENFKPKEW